VGVDGGASIGRDPQVRLALVAEHHDLVSDVGDHPQRCITSDHAGSDDSRGFDVDDR